MQRLILIIALVAVNITIHAQPGIEAIMKRVYEEEIKTYRGKEKQVTGYLSAQQPDGSWQDINYKDSSMTVWSATKHIERLLSLAGVYVEANSALKGRTNVYKGLVNGLNFWLKENPLSKNWWHNQIDMPQKTGELLIIMRYADQKLPANLEQQLIERMKRGNPDAMTGANKTDIAMHYFYRALLTSNKDLLTHALEQLFMPVALVDGKEGLQYDFSYLQHGPQLYISGYGEEFIKGVLKISTYVAGTPYAMNKEKLGLFSEFYRNVYLKTIKNNYIDFSVHGRGVSRPDILLKKGEVNRMKNLVLQDIDHSVYWGKTIQDWTNSKAENTPFHQHFWKGDYTLHVRPAYNFNVRIASNRTKRTEAGNKENLYGKFLPDGATNIQVEGPEYYNIMPLWEWDKIPGTTSKDYAEDQPLTEFWGVFGNNRFAGGISDQLYGLTAYQLHYNGVRANKAWFFFDDQVVCLGSGLQADGSEHLVTTVNQSWLKGAVSVGGKNQAVQTAATKEYPAGTMVYHNQVAYYFPEAARIGISNQTQSGSWYRINNAHPAKVISGDVFKIWIDHGAAPHNAGYAYIVMPGVKPGKDQAPPTAIKILENSNSQQVVFHAGLKLYQAVLYEAGKIILGDFYIKTDHPCLLQLRAEANGVWQLSVADPLQSVETLNLLVGKNDGSKPKLLKVQMPDGPYRGSTKQLSFAL